MHWHFRGSEVPRLLLPLVYLVFFCATFNAGAIVDANSGANTNAPPDGAPWGNVGTVNGATGVYLANGWVLTASHVGSGNFILSGTTFSPDGLVRQLTNSDTSLADIVLFHLKAPPAIPSLALASSPPGNSALVDMIGFGYISGSPQSPLGSHTGFYWSASGMKSWGNNRVDPGGLWQINAGAGPVIAFTTTFTAPGPSQTSDEAQAAIGDSGGGVFQLTGSGWQMVGMVDAVSFFSDQPSGTSAFGSQTYSADISSYRTQILSIIATTPPLMWITRSGGNIQVSWADVGIVYDLEVTATLTAVAWATVSTQQVTSNGVISVTLPAAGNYRFFRLHKSDGSQP